MRACCFATTVRFKLRLSCSEISVRETKDDNPTARVVSCSHGGESGKERERSHNQISVNEITCWSDSTVLYWLQGTETYKQFVANRVTKIQSHEDVGWRYVPSSENPADMGSRGDQSNKRELWLNGPKWLQDPDTWPSNIVAQPSIESRAETKPAKEIANVAVVQQNERDEVLAKFGPQKAVEYVHGSIDSKTMRYGVLVLTVSRDL